MLLLKKFFKYEYKKKTHIASSPLQGYVEVSN